MKQEMIAEIQNEAASTQKMLERVPADKFEWRPHEKSRTLKQLATHIVNLSGMPGIVTSTPYLDFAEKKGQAPEINNTQDLVRQFQKNTQLSIEALQAAKEEDLDQSWTMKSGERTILQAPRSAAIRRMGMNHVYHHRAQLGVYLRLLGVPVPGMYGPSADDATQTKK